MSRPQDVLRIARTLILARVAQAKGDHRTAIGWFEQAAALQDALPYTEPPYWYYPIRQSLAAALLQARRYAQAERQFQLALSRAPSNGWSYYGLAELYKARGNTAAARKAEAISQNLDRRPRVVADLQSLSLHRCRRPHLMSAFGTKRTSQCAQPMSAIVCKAGIRRT